MKLVLLSIKPKYVELIAGGKKTIEVRKNRPKIDTPFKCYIYCTIGNGVKGDYLVPSGIQCGKVIGEFTCDWINEFYYDQAFDESMGVFLNSFGYEIMSGDLEQTCLSYEEFEKYGNMNTLYGWHISNLKIYDKPKDLNEFTSICKFKDGNCDICVFYKKAFGGCCRTIKSPQSWCYVEEL